MSLIQPNLMFYEGSALVVDTKGELARLTAARRGRGVRGGKGGLGQDVYVLDPFGVSGVETSTFNPLAELDLDSPDLIDDATMFADALIIHPERGIGRNRRKLCCGRSFWSLWQTRIRTGAIS